MKITHTSMNYNGYDREVRRMRRRGIMLNIPLTVDLDKWVNQRSTGDINNMLSNSKQTKLIHPAL